MFAKRRFSSRHIIPQLITVFLLILRTDATHYVYGPETFLQWLLYPNDSDSIISDHIHLKPLHVQRQSRDHYHGLNLHQAQDDDHFSLNVTNLWIGNNHGVRYLYATQRYSNITRNLVTSFMEFIPGCIVQTHLILIPSRAKGIKKWDDNTDLFVLQIRGSKRWKVHDPFPMKVTLNEGDLLYVPKWIEYETLLNLNVDDGDEDGESLHIQMTVRSELFADYLYDLISDLMITCKQCKQWLLEQFLNSGGGESGDEGIEYLNSNLYQLLDGAKWTDHSANKALPYWFICGAVDGINDTDMQLFTLFDRYFIEFVERLREQQDKPSDEDASTLLFKIKRKLERKHYAMYLNFKFRRCMKQKRVNRARIDKLDVDVSAEIAKEYALENQARILSEKA